MTGKGEEEKNDEKMTKGGRERGQVRGKRRKATRKEAISWKQESRRKEHDNEEEKGRRKMRSQKICGNEKKKIGRIWREEDV